MSITVNGTLLIDQLDLDITVTQAEVVIDGAINLLNTFGAELDNLGGSAGSKTEDYTSAQAGAITTMSQKVYAKHHINPDQTSSSNLGPVGQSFGTDTELLTYAKELATALKTATTTGNIAIFVSNDPVPT
jgi:hypothetical protein